MIKNFEKRCDDFFRIYYVKRIWQPSLRVISAKRTRKGWHLVILFNDFEHKREWDSFKTLILQDFFNSDVNRSLYDMLRLERKEKRWNLLFDWKRGFTAKEDKKMVDKLNYIISKKVDYYSPINKR